MRLAVADEHIFVCVVVRRRRQDKLTQLDNYKLLGATGPTGDRNNFCEYIQKNVHLYELKTGVPLSTHAAAAYTRNQLAEALRRNPYQASAHRGRQRDREGGEGTHTGGGVCAKPIAKSKSTSCAAVHVLTSSLLSFLVCSFFRRCPCCWAVGMRLWVRRCSTWTILAACIR